MATNGQQTLGNGVGSFFHALGQAPLLAAQGAEQYQNAQSQNQLRSAQIGDQLASTALKQNELNTMQGRPDMLRLMAASRAGVSVPEFNAAINERTYGAPAVGPALLPEPIEGIGPSGRTSRFDDVISNLFAPAMTSTSKDINFDQLAQARGEGQDQAALEQALNAANTGDYMRSSALSAVRGKKEFTPFAAVGTTGTALNQVTGAQPVSNPGIRALFGDKVGSEILENKAQAGSANASAASSYASAKQHKAQTDKIITETGQIVNAPKGRFDPASGLLIDERAGTARPVLDQMGNPIAPRFKELNEAQAKDNGYGSRMMEADAIIKSLQGKYSPTAVNARIAAQNSVVPGAGIVANLIQSEEGQQVEQAQRDFINAILRRESGAAIAQGEFDNARQQYFPQPNDKAGTLEQKARNRKIAIEGVFGSVPKDRRGVPSLRSPGPVADGVVKISSDAEYDAIPSGAAFIDPEGRQRRKP